MRRAALALAIGLAACGGGPAAHAPGEAPPVSVPATGTIDVQLHVVDERPGTPPLVRLAVDVVVLNTTAAARWVLLPTDLGHAYGDGGVDVLELERWGDATVAAWQGTGGFRAVRVGPGARLALDAMPVRWWRHDDDPMPALIAAAAGDVLIDGRGLATWFDADPTVTSDSAGGPRGATVATATARPDRREAPVALRDPVAVRAVPWPRD